MFNPDDPKPLRECRINPIPSIIGDTPLFDLLNIFQEGRSHMAVVVDGNPPVPIGIVTLEDVLEELIQEEIYDESDSRIGLAVKLEVSKKKRGSSNYSKFKRSNPIRSNTDPVSSRTNSDFPRNDNKK